MHEIDFPIYTYFRRICNICAVKFYPTLYCQNLYAYKFTQKLLIYKNICEELVIFSLIFQERILYETLYPSCAMK